MITGFEVRGLDDVGRMLEEIGPRIANNLIRSTVHAAAGEYRDEIKKGAPDDPSTGAGDLKKSIKAKRERSRKKHKARSTIRSSAQGTRKGGKAGMFYWKAHEYGTTKIPENPFVRTATEKVNTTIEQKFLEHFAKKYEAALKRQANKV